MLASGAFIGLAACGGGSASPVTPSGGLQVGGTYSINRSWVTQGCSPPTPGATATVTGTVTQRAGSSDFVLSNSDGGTFSGHIAAGGAFTTGTVSSVGGNGVSYSVLLEGQFTTSGFAATLTGDQMRPTGTCREVIAWVAVKQGPANVIP